MPLRKPTVGLLLLSHITSAASFSQGGLGGGVWGAAPGPGTRSAAQLGPMKPAQLPARAPYVQPCHTEGRAALGGTDLSSTCRQNPTLPGRSAVLEVGGAGSPALPAAAPRRPARLAAYTWL